MQKFQTLQALDAESKKAIEKPVRHSLVQVAEILELERRFKKLFNSVTLTLGLCALFAVPTLFLIFAPNFGFNFTIITTIKSTSNADEGFRLIVSFSIVMAVLLISLIPAFIMMEMFSKRIRNYLEIVGFALFFQYFILAIMGLVLSNILYVARTRAPSMFSQLLAICLLGMISYFVVLIGVIFPSYALLEKFMRRPRRMFANAFIVKGFISALFMIEKNPAKWGEVEFKRRLIGKLEEISSFFEYHLPSHLRSSDIFTDNWIKEVGEQIAAGIRSLIKWVYTPKIDTRQHLIEILSKNLMHTAKGEWDRLERLSPEQLTRPELLRSRTKTIAIAILSGAVPVLFLHLVQYLGLIEMFILKPLIIAGYLWAVVTVLSHLDPSYDAKLTNIKDLTQWLPFTGKSNKEQP